MGTSQTEGQAASEVGPMRIKREEYEAMKTLIAKACAGMPITASQILAEKALRSIERCFNVSKDLNSKILLYPNND